MEMLNKAPVERLPEPLRPLADPKRSLPDAVRAAYEPPAHEKLNMARLVLWFASTVGVLGVLFSLLINRNRLAFSATITVLCLAGLLWVRAEYRKHNACGGDTRRLGVYVLPEGILALSEEKGKVMADFVPREAVTGFDVDENAEAYADTRIRVMTAEGPWAAYDFPSVGMLEAWHREKLENWLHNGGFAWAEYKKPKNVQKES